MPRALDPRRSHTWSIDEWTRWHLRQTNATFAKPPYYDSAEFVATPGKAPLNAWGGAYEPRTGRRYVVPPEHRGTAEMLSFTDRRTGSLIKGLDGHYGWGPQGESPFAHHLTAQLNRHMAHEQGRPTPEQIERERISRANFEAARQRQLAQVLARDFARR